MLVAGDQGEVRSAYGSASRKMLVRKALMVLANLPRKLGPNEELNLPVSVFATSPELREVELFSQSSDPDSALTQRLTMSFDQPKEQEQLAFVTFKTSDKVGKQTLRFTAEAGSWVATQKVTMPVTFGNPMSSVEAQRAIKSYESAVIPLPSFGVEGTTSGTFEVSRLPALSLNAHLSYLTGYPHGCAEQTTSKAFPQLYLSHLRDLTGSQKATIQKNVEVAIEKLKRYQLPQGEFAYWPGGEWSSWVNTYIGHFLLEARRLGYLVPQEMLKAWGERQVELAKMWSEDEPQGSSAEEEQAYRLLTLALAQRADLSAMNRLRQRAGLSGSARWLLARAYALAGQRLAAHELVEGLDVQGLLTPTKAQSDVMRGFKSSIRDLGLALLTLVELHDERTELALTKLISHLNQRKGHTHELATSIIALGTWAAKFNAEADLQPARVDELYFSYSFADQKVQATQSEKVTWARSLTAEELKATHVRVMNTSPQTLYVNLHRRGIPKAGQEQDDQRELKLSVRYLNAQGEEVQPERLTQGAELVAELKVSAEVSYDLGQLALTYPIPSGWELENSRLSGSDQGDVAIYRDLRDDRALIYFKLPSGQEKTFKVPLRATFAGRFYHPATLVEAMYVPSARAQKRGFWVEVKRP
jgi:alpha-2-macroglobulin